MKILEFFLRNGTRIIARAVINNGKDGWILHDPYQITSHFDPNHIDHALWYPFFDYLPASEDKTIVIQISDLLFEPKTIRAKWRALYDEMQNELVSDDQLITEDLRFQA